MFQEHPDPEEHRKCYATGMLYRAGFLKRVDLVALG